VNKDLSNSNAVWITPPELWLCQKKLTVARNSNRVYNTRSNTPEQRSNNKDTPELRSWPTRTEELWRCRRRKTTPVVVPKTNLEPDQDLNRWWKTRKEQKLWTCERNRAVRGQGGADGCFNYPKGGLGWWREELCIPPDPVATSLKPDLDCRSKTVVDGGFWFGRSERTENARCRPSLGEVSIQYIFDNYSIIFIL
jgi:hypothetical protein